MAKTAWGNAMLLTSLLLLVGAADAAAPKGPPPDQAAARLEQVRSQRSKDNPLSQSVVQPIQPTACADNRPACRHLDFVDIRSNNGVARLEINADLDYLDNNILTLFPGESVVLRLQAATTGAAKLTVVRSGLATEADKGAGAMVASPAAVAAMSADPSRVASIVSPAPLIFELEPDQVRFSFVQATGQEDSLLRVENGAGQILGYRALMRVMNGSVQPTDVCQVMPEKLGYEPWPHPIATLILGQMQKLPPGPARPPACQ